MSETPQQPVTVAEVARVGIDLPCITCGYNLRSLPMTPMRGWLFPGIFLLLMIELGTFGWMICGVVALFWFRRVFSRAIAQNVARPLKAVARQ